MKKTTRWLAGSLGLCGVLLLGGCAAPGPYGDYGYGPSSGGYSSSYSDSAPPNYGARPGYGSRPGYGGRPGRPDPGYRPGGNPGIQPGDARPGRGNPTPQQLAPSVNPILSPNDRSMPIESQRILRERASGTTGGS